MSSEMEIKEKIAISTVGVSVSTLLSRILGYIRDMLTADLLGAGMAADALFVAYRIPNLFRRLLGEGALSASFIPVFTEYLGVKGEKEAKELFNMILIILSLVLMTLTVCGIIFTPFIVRLIAPGFAGSSGKMELTVMLTRILLPFMVAIGTGALALGVLNSLHLFMIPALAPCMLSISEIFFLLFICPGMGKPVFGLAFGILIGGFAQMSFQIPPIARRGYFEGFFSGIHEKISSAFKHPGVRNIGLLMLPATIGLSVSQINTFVDAICASF